MRLTLQSPVIITPRLLPGVEIRDSNGVAWVSIEYSDKPGDGHRVRYKTYIDYSPIAALKEGVVKDSQECEAVGYVRDHAWDGPGLRPNGSWEYSDDDIQSGSHHGLQQGLASAVVFLSACGESYGYRLRKGEKAESDDNADSYPPHIAAWAHQQSDELASLACELEEGVGLIVEE